MKTWHTYFAGEYLGTTFQVERLAMLPSNRAKNLLYQLLNAGYINVHVGLQF